MDLQKDKLKIKSIDILNCYGSNWEFVWDPNPAPILVSNFGSTRAQLKKRLIYIIQITDMIGIQIGC